MLPALQRFHGERLATDQGASLFFWESQNAFLGIQNSKFKMLMMPRATKHFELTTRARAKTVISSKPEPLILNFEF
jgi:hypothetical protein